MSEWARVILFNGNKPAQDIDVLTEGLEVYKVTVTEAYTYVQWPVGKVIEEQTWCNTCGKIAWVETIAPDDPEADVVGVIASTTMYCDCMLDALGNKPNCICHDCQEQLTAQEFHYLWVDNEADIIAGLDNPGRFRFCLRCYLARQKECSYPTDDIDMGYSQYESEVEHINWVKDVTRSRFQEEQDIWEYEWHRRGRDLALANSVCACPGKCDCIPF